MSHLPYTLAENAGKVFESGARSRRWSLSDPYQGVEVNVENRRFDELTASFYFVLPRLVSRHGSLSLLTIARGFAGDPSEPPEFQDSAALLEVSGGVYAHVTYDASRCEFDVCMNAGSEIPELVGVSLKGAPPELVCGRLLELYLEIDAERIFASVHDRFLDHGDLSLDGVAPSTGEDRRPWGASPAGFWWVLSGLPEVVDDRSSPLPAGFGVSDLRITLGSALESPAGSLAYQGALDHLVVARPEPRPLSIPKWEARTLLRHAKALREIADDLDRVRLLLPLEDGVDFETLDSSETRSV